MSKRCSSRGPALVALAAGGMMLALLALAVAGYDASNGGPLRGVFGAAFDMCITLYVIGGLLATAAAVSAIDRGASR